MFFPQTLPIHRAAVEGRAPSLLLSFTSNRSGTFRYLFATLHARRLPRTFNRILVITRLLLDDIYHQGELSFDRLVT